MPDSLTARVKALAREVGFDLVGVTTAEPFEREEAAMVARVRSGMMDGLPWFTEARARLACRPRELLPDARSVIAVAAGYYTGESPAADGVAPSREGRGKVARYAWGRDYHAVLRKKLRAFVERLPEVAGRPVRTRLFVDTGPLAERTVAARAGIGWYGKNTNVLTREMGSWVFLASVITDLELEPDRPLRKSCGRCAACIPACPTGALTPYALDNRRCISYLTIECRGPIPRALRPLVGTWVFGCDICQEVCPVNKRAQAPLVLSPSKDERERTGEPLVVSLSNDAAHAVDRALPELLPLLALTEEGFAARFRGTAVTRAKRRGLARNVCVALGNIGDPAATPALARALRQDEEPLVRGHAAWALGRIGGPAAEEALRLALASEADASVREEIEAALESLAASSPFSQARKRGR
ncbi:MAG: tRNA epoxyqueuosine(34) reductase QueG [Chloroflexota bacterium]